jgi:uncharacterized membrane protein
VKDNVALHNDRGFSSVTFMLMMLVLVLAVGAISVDLWHLVAEHREVAGVVDGAAIAAASAIDDEALRLDPRRVQIDAGRAVARACSYLQANGEAGLCPGPDARVVVGTDTVTVTMRRDVNLTLLRIFSGLDPGADTSPIEVGATSTAGIATR